MSFFFFFDNGFFDQPNSLDDLAAIAIVVKWMFYAADKERNYFLRSSSVVN